MPRNPTHPEIHLLEGTFRKDRHAPPGNVTLLEPLEDANPPQWLDEPAAEKFRQVWRVLEPLRVLCALDLDLLATYAELQSRYERDPAAFTASMLAQLRAIRGELGLSPSLRARLANAQVRAKRRNKFSRAMND